MNTAETNDTSDSLAETGVEQAEATTAQPDATAASSTATGAKPTASPTDEGDSAESEFHKRVKALEGSDEDKPDSPTDTEDADSDTKSEKVAAVKDESAKTPDKAEAKSQDSEHNEGFHNLPEWKKLVELAGPKKKEAIEQLRSVFEKQTKLQKEVERSKPAVEVTERIRKAVGDDGVKNTVALIESWNRGDESALKILKELTTDLETRLGVVLSSPELVKESKELDDQLEQQLIDKPYYDKRKAELLKLQKGEAVVKQTVEEKAEAAKAARIESNRRIIAEREAAIESWEIQARKDPDYAAIEELIAVKARALVDERQAAHGQELLPTSAMVQVLEDAKKWAKDQLLRNGPKRQAIKAVVNGNGGNSSINSRREAATPEEEFHQRVQALEARGRR